MLPKYKLSWQNNQQNKARHFRQIPEVPLNLEKGDKMVEFSENNGINQTPQAHTVSTSNGEPKHTSGNFTIGQSQPNSYIIGQPQTFTSSSVHTSASELEPERKVEPKTEQNPDNKVMPKTEMNEIPLKSINKTNKGALKCWSEALTRMADFSGRTSRYEFWAFQSVSLVIFLLMSLVGYFLSEPKMVLDIFAVYFLLPAASSCVRRLHDVSMSGWWVLPAVILALATLVCWNLGIRNIVLLLYFTLIYVSVLYSYLRRVGDKTLNSYGLKIAESVENSLDSSTYINFMTTFMVGLWIIYAAYLIKF